jgi:hypothetical protein
MEGARPVEQKIQELVEEGLHLVSARVSSAQNCFAFRVSGPMRKRVLVRMVLPMLGLPTLQSRYFTHQ